MQFLVSDYRVSLLNAELQIFCGCGASADLAQSTEAGRIVWGYFGSKDGHAVTDFVDERELATFQQDWRNELIRARSR